MPRFLQRAAWIAALCVAGCNRQAAVLDTPVSPSPTAAPVPVPAQPQISGIRISPGGVEGGDAATGMVTLAGEAQVFPVTVSLSSNNEAVIVPSEATVPAGSTIGRFSVTTRRFPDDRRVVISASTSERTVTTNFEVWAIDAPVFFKYFSDEGDFIGGGGVGRFTPANATISAVCDRNEVRIQVIAPDQVWLARFKAYGTQPLITDVYHVQGDTGFSGELANMHISGRSRACSTVEGSFYISEIDLRNNRVNAFHAEFEQYCNENPQRAELYGEIRMTNMPPNSSVVNCFR
jgi:hypothetical protein